MNIYEFKGDYYFETEVITKAVSSSLYKCREFAKIQKHTSSMYWAWEEICKHPYKTLEKEIPKSFLQEEGRTLSNEEVLDFAKAIIKTISLEGLVIEDKDYITSFKILSPKQANERLEKIENEAQNASWFPLSTASSKVKNAIDKNTPCYVEITRDTTSWKGNGKNVVSRIDTQLYPFYNLFVLNGIPIAIYDIKDCYYDNEQFEKNCNVIVEKAAKRVRRWSASDSQGYH